MEEEVMIVLAVAFICIAAVAIAALFAIKQIIENAQDQAEAAQRQHLAMVNALIAQAAKERESLEDRLMAVCEPEQLALFKASTDDTVTKTKYVDEQREFELDSEEENEVVYAPDA